MEKNNMKYKNILIGADIEVFLQHKPTGEIVSAEGFVRGTKNKPYCFDKSNKYFATSLDNVLAEYCIPPAKTKSEFYRNIAKSMGYINTSIPKDFCTLAFPAANLHERFLRTENALLFGCEPDFNAYTQWVNPRPNAEEHTLRSAGGHIHIGYDGAGPVFDLHNPDDRIVSADTDRQNIIKALDLFLSVPLVLIEPDNKRKELYGKAGAYRPKKYGVEYRTISNYYASSEKLTKWAFSNTKEAINWLNKGNAVDKELGAYVAETINTNNKKNAEYLIDALNIKTP